jgi:hypothetical protein
MIEETGLARLFAKASPAKAPQLLEQVAAGVDEFAAELGCEDDQSSVMVTMPWRDDATAPA